MVFVWLVPCRKPQAFSGWELYPIFYHSAIIMPHVLKILLSFSAIENMGWSSFTLLMRLWFIVPIWQYCAFFFFFISHFCSFSLFVTFTRLKLSYWLDLWGKEIFAVYWYSTCTLLVYYDTKNLMQYFGNFWQIS